MPTDNIKTVIVRESDFEEYTNEVSYTGTQGASTDGEFAWITAGQTDGSWLWEIDLSDWSFVQELRPVPEEEITNENTMDGSLDPIPQTSHYYDGTIYQLNREPEVYEIDAETLDHVTTHQQVIPETEYHDNIYVFEGITRYDGDAFAEPKWFFNTRGTSNDADRAIYRLDDQFNFEERYILNETNPELEGENDGYDGITVLDHQRETILIGSVTASNPNYPNVEVFVYDEDDDDWLFLGRPDVDGDELKLPDEGFQVHTINEVFCGLRYPYGDDSDDREVALSLWDWEDIVKQFDQMGEIRSGKLELN